MSSSFDDVLTDLRALALSARLDDLWAGRSAGFRTGLRAYIEEIGEYRDTAKRHPGTNEIDGVFLRNVADGLLSRGTPESTDIQWREGVAAAMWLLIGAHWRDIVPGEPPSA